MRICDSCNGRGDKEMATDELILTREDQKLDICNTCKTRVIEAFYNNGAEPVKKKRGRPRKNEG